MSNHYLVVDDVRRAYFDCDKLLPYGENAAPDTLRDAQDFEPWLRTVNWGDDPPEQTNRFLLALPEGRLLYDFLVTSGWKARIVSLDSDDYEAITETWQCAGTLERP